MRHVQATLCTPSPEPPLAPGHNTVPKPGLGNHLALQQQPSSQAVVALVEHAGADWFEAETLPDRDPAWAPTKALWTPRAKATPHTKASQARASSEKVTKSNQDELRRARGDRDP